MKGVLKSRVVCQKMEFDASCLPVKFKDLKFMKFF